MDYLETLNSEQKKAVLKTDGPVLIVAGAGAGKTKTIAHRILHLIAGGVSPENILAITFTNKAAKEMRERVHSLLSHVSGHRGRLPFVSTFHSLGVQILKENSDLMKLPRHFSIYDTADSKKTLKDALVSMSVDPKEHLDKVRHIISTEKGRGVSLSEYQERASHDYTSDLTKKVWAKYEETLRKEQALDFDDLLLKTLKLLQKHDDVLEKYQERFLYIHIDEYQDTNKVQNSIVELLAKKYRNICVVGDTDQCLVGGTKIKMADGTLKPIEHIKSGEFVLSNYGSGDFRSAKITRKKTKRFKGNLIRIETMKGKVITSTPEHVHFAGYRLGSTPQTYLNYLMYKNGVGWRIGTTSVYTKGQKKPVVGFIQRSNQEHADAVWIIATHKSEKESRINEYVLSLKYQIPTIPFTARKGSSVNGYVHDDVAIKNIFSLLDTEKSALKLLGDIGLSPKEPHHQPRTRNSNRRNINIILCGDRRGKNPMHNISIHGNDSAGRKKLESIGLSIRKSKNNKNWRFESVRSSYGEVCLLANKIISVFPEANLVFSARLGGGKDNPRDGNSLPHIQASSIRVGMSLFSTDGYDVVSKISKIQTIKINVFDLDIEKTHNFIANDIVTHNCIYSWRGAEIKNFLHFEKTYPEVETVFLEQNYRSTKNILAVANEIIEKNNFRIPKRTRESDTKRCSAHLITLLAIF
ncbi:MAG: UvrD-helicase domain-containing protein [Nitrospira sp.]